MYTKTGLQTIGSKTYYFDNDHYVLSGVIEDDDKHYYFRKKDGARIEEEGVNKVDDTFFLVGKGAALSKGWYRDDNGKRYNKLNYEECYQRLIDFPAKRFLRNGIGHNNINYDGITQIITAYDLKDPNRIKYKDSLMNMAIDCIGLAKSAVVFSEMILFMLRHELKAEGIHSIMHPRFYKGVKLNDNCPCGSGIKYKKCCMNDVEMVLRSL